MTARGEMVCLIAAVVFLSIVAVTVIVGVVKGIYDAIQERRYGNEAYAVAIYYKGKAECLNFFHVVDDKETAVLHAKDLLWNTLDYKSIVYIWNNKEERVEGIVWEGDTFPKKVAAQKSDVLPGQISLEEVQG